MFVVQWSWLLVGRDILVALIVVAVAWFLSAMIRFGDELDVAAEKKWVLFLLFVASIVLCFKWGIVVVR